MHHSPSWCSLTASFLSMPPCAMSACPALSIGRNRSYTSLFGAARYLETQWNNDHWQGESLRKILGNSAIPMVLTHHMWFFLMQRPRSWARLARSRPNEMPVLKCSTPPKGWKKVGKIGKDRSFLGIDNVISIHFHSWSEILQSCCVRSFLGGWLWSNTKQRWPIRETMANFHLRVFLKPIFSTEALFDEQ
jgi:hypothetical protein